ncbi:MAG: MBL fold metallo-hydrolase [Verrucomicrobia bacterium]|nr:MBL fold metallo-hydrolase [Verrucomicrobiota bacterium]
MLTVTFLGTGTSVGVPVPLCDCRVCHSQDSRDQRWRSSVYIETPSACWVIDTAVEFRLQAIRAKIARLDAVIYTHAHADHILGFDDLRRFSTANGDEMPIYASKETLAHLARTFAYAFNSEIKIPGYVQPLVYAIDGPFCLGDNEIIPIPVEHGRIHTLGFLVRQGEYSKFGYISDCKVISDQGLHDLAGVETLVLGTPLKMSRFSHLSLTEGLALVSLLKPRQAYFTHLGHDFLHAETEKSLPENCFLAYDGLRLELS